MSAPWVPLSYRIGRGLDGSIRCTRTEVRVLAELGARSLRGAGEEGNPGSGQALARLLIADFLSCSPSAPVVEALLPRFVDRWLRPLSLSWGQRTEITGPQLEEWLSDLARVHRPGKAIRSCSGSGPHKDAMTARLSLESEFSPRCATAPLGREHAVQGARAPERKTGLQSGAEG